MARNSNGNPIIAAWDRQPAEHPRHFAAFCLYRDMGVNRTIAAVRSETGYSKSTMDGIVKRWKWQSRVLAYERNLDQYRQSATALSVHNMAQRQAALGQKLQTVAERRIDQIAADPGLMATLTASDAVRLATEGVKIERLAEGESTGDEGGQAIIFNLVANSHPKWAPKHVTSPSPAAPPPAHDLLTPHGN